MGGDLIMDECVVVVCLYTGVSGQSGNEFSVQNQLKISSTGSDINRFYEDCPL